MGAPIDMTGKKYGRLTVIEMAGRNKHNQRLWRCICDCGNETEVIGYSIRYGDTLSCGCLKKELIASVNMKHGMSKSHIWSIHKSMMDRCYLPTAFAYSRYGGRGIRVCDRWHSFENFFADMGHRPEDMSLERVDNNGDYCPDNVRWGTAEDQANNRRSNRLIAYNGETKTLAQWAKSVGMSIGTLWSRLTTHGYSIEQALTKPVGRWA